MTVDDTLLGMNEVIVDNNLDNEDVDIDYDVCIHEDTLTVMF